jgi:putative ABC transport system substrate-binding protein
VRRRDLLAAFASAAAASPARAQAPTRQYRIAIADPAFTAAEWRKLPLYRPIFPELRRLGDVEGRNLRVAYFGAEGHVERYADLARRVVESDPDLIVSV